MARRGLSDRDRADWASFARGVVPLPGHDLPGHDLNGPPVLPAAEAAIPPPAAVLLPAAPVLVRAPVVAPLVIGAAPAGLDSGTWTRFRGGRIAPVRTLDLHGRTAQRAFYALLGFLHAAHGDRLRCVEVITGRGAGEAGGVIRREFPLWLNLSDIRPLVLAAAHPHAANPGSVRLLLRRPR